MLHTWYKTAMEESEYVIMDVQSKLQSEITDNPAYGVFSSKPEDMNPKKPPRDWFRWCVVIGLVLVGVVACVSMAVAVSSITMSNSSENMTLPVDMISKFDASIASVIKLLRNEISLVREFAMEVNMNTIEAVGMLGNLTAALSGSGAIPTYPATSCLGIIRSIPYTPSGYYWVRAGNGSAVRVYCDMTRSCGGVTGGWIRVASLDFNNSSTPCPSGLQERMDSGIRTCGIQSSNPTCASVLFTTHNIAYAEVCGKVLAYQFGDTDAFGEFGTIRRGTPNQTIDSNYVDGVSLTHGRNPREHIWTFAAAFNEFGGSMEDTSSICECSNSGRDGSASPGFVAKNYFCDSGALGTDHPSRDRFFSTSLLWDGSGCGPSSTCCSFNNPPWFYRQLPSPTSDAIEMRVCSDEERDSEDIRMSSVEIYVQ